MPEQPTPLTKTRIFGTADRAALYLKTFATACREEDDEETAMVVEAAAAEIERLRRGLTIISKTADVDSDTCATIAKRYIDNGEW